MYKAMLLLLWLASLWMGSRTEQALQIKSRPSARPTVYLTLQKHVSFVRAYTSFVLSLNPAFQVLCGSQNCFVSVREEVESLFLA